MPKKPTKAVVKRTAQAVDNPAETNLLQIIGRAASDPNVDIDKMDRLLQMQERILANQAKIEFDQAFSDMQIKLPVIQERGAVSGRYTYAKWNDINEAILPVLSKHGFGLNFKTSIDGEGVHVTAILRHRAGHEITSEFWMAADTSGSKNAPQAAGSSVSYCKRYTAMALLNLQTTADDDDDGRAGGTKSISKEDFEKLNKTLDDEGVDKSQFCKRYSLASISELPEAKLALVYAELKQRRLEIELRETKEKNDG